MKFTLDPETLEKVLIAFAEIMAGLILGPLMKRFIMRLSKKVWDKGAMTFIGSFANIAIIVISVIIAMDQLGINTNVLVSAFSALGLGISLALKDNMANVAGGLQLLMTRPFVIGDYVKVGSHEGYVRSIELMYTTLETFGNKEVIVPNSKMISKIVTNFSKEPTRRVSIKVPIFKLSNLEEAQNVILKILQSNPMVLKDPKPMVTVTRLRHEFVDITAFAYCESKNYWPLFYELNTEIARQVKEDLVTPPISKAPESSSNPADNAAPAGPSEPANLYPMPDVQLVQGMKDKPETQEKTK